MRPDITPFFHAQSHTFSYLVVCPTTGEAAVIDSCLDFDDASGRTSEASVAAMDEALRAHGARLRWILETHAHADHLSGAQALKARWPEALVVIGAGIIAAQARFRPLLAIPEDEADARAFDRLLTEGEALPLGELRIDVIATPGHTDDSLSYCIGDAVFVGDSLFLPDSGTARCDFPGGDAATLYRSIQRLFALPDDTRVFVGHDYGPGGRAIACESTIGAQKAANIHVGGGCDVAGFVRKRQARDAILGLPALLLPALQVNLRGGRLPTPPPD